VSFSSEGRTLAAGYDSSVGDVGGGVVLWEVGGRVRLQEKPLAVAEGNVYSVSFSPEGRTLAAGYGSRVGGGGGVVLWEVGGRVRLQDQPLAVAEGYVSSVSFSPDGKTLAAGYGRDVGVVVGGVVLWDVDLDSWRCHARQTANRNLTRAEWRQYFPDTPYRPTFDDLPIPPEKHP
jgi:WD40 repeat protein